MTCDDCDTLLLENNKLKDQLFQTSDTFAVTSAKNSALYETLLTQQEFLSKLSTKLELFKKDKHHHEQSINQLQTQVNALEKEKCSLLDYLKLETKKANQFKTELEKAHLDLQSLRHEYESEQNSKNSLIDELKHAHHDQQKLREQVMDLEYEVRQCVEKLGYLNMLKSELNESKEFINSLKSQNTELRMLLDKRAKPMEHSSPRVSEMDANLFAKENKEPVKVSVSPDQRRSRSLLRRSFHSPDSSQSPIKSSGHIDDVVGTKRRHLRMTVDASHDKIIPWYEIASKTTDHQETPTFLVEEAEKAKDTVAEFTEYIKQLGLQ